MSNRKLVVPTAQGWFDATRDSKYSMGERLLFMENALNHTENALVAAREDSAALRQQIDSMKNCQNCKWENERHRKCNGCYHSENWQMKGAESNE